MEQEKKPNYDELYEQTIIINNQNTEYEEKPHKISLGNQLNIEDTIQEKIFLDLNMKNIAILKLE